MHACLNVDEILRLIASELVGSRGNGTAVTLACCCKSFEDPVLDALWKRQVRLSPLLESLPGGVWEEDICISFKRLPTAIEWARFRKYARRMRELNDTLAVMSLEVLSALKLRTIDEPLLPNLETLHLWGVDQPFNQFIPFFLSLRVTSISLAFDSDCPKAMVASMVSSLPTLCPHIQKIYLGSLPTDPTITAAVSGIVLAANLNTLQEFHVDSPLTEEASEVVYELPSLRNLSVVIGGEASLPSASLPNLTELLIRCDDEGGWPRLFHGATLGKLKSVKFCARSEEIGDFLGAFERAALSSSVQNTLSEFYILGPCSWIPNYSSLLSFTQMVDLDIVFLCHSRCSSTVDDDIVISLSRAMPKLTGLQLGYVPCGEPTSGVTVKGLVALALHCPDLQRLCIHFQVASLSAPSASSGFGRNTEPTGSQAVCALKKLVVGYILVPEESALMVALTLLQIFPRIENIKFIVDRGWGKVKDAIRLSKRIVDCSRITLETEGRKTG